MMKSSNDREGRTRSADNVEIAFSVRGSGDITLVFIHGGLANRGFWAPQLDSLADRYRVVALDLAGHGESGRDRTAWTIPAFAGDVRAVAETLALRQAVLIGNSLGGPVALDAARLLSGRVLGVVAVDTLHDVTVKLGRDEARARAEAFRKDSPGACRAMAGSLFHPGAHAELRAWVEERMCETAPEVAAGMMEGMGGYDLAEAFRMADVPVRAIVGDLWPVNIERNRTINPDFDAVVMTGCGHYPMLERPAEFNRLLVETVRGLKARGQEDPTGRRVLP